MSLAEPNRTEEDHFLLHIAPVLERTVSVLAWQKLTRKDCARAFKQFADMLEAEETP